MKQSAPTRKVKEGIAFEGDTIAFRSDFPLWLRFFLLPWVPICLPFISLYLQNTQGIDWDDPPIAGLIFGIFGFVLAPLAFSAFLLGMALFGSSTRLRLDPGAGEAVLERKAPFRRRLTRYVLSEVRIFKIELEADYPAYDAATVTLRMPDGKKVRIYGFWRDEEAKYWAEQIRRITNPGNGQASPA